MIKEEIRVIGIDDSPFTKNSKRDTLVIGTIFRGGKSIDGILSTKVTIDGNNSTKKLIELINKSRFKPQLRCIFLDGIALGGFNIIDIKELSKQTRLPVIVIMRKKPDLKKINAVLNKIGKRDKIQLLEKAGPIIPVGNIFIQLTGLEIDRAKEILKIVTYKSNIPECIRISHLIASGIAFGESHGKA